MAEDPSNDEAKLKLLGQRVREGWSKLHPPTDQHRAAVREVVRQQIGRVQQAAKQVPRSEEEISRDTAHEHTKSKTAEKSKSGEVQGDGSSASKKSGQSNDHGHSH